MLKMKRNSGASFRKRCTNGEKDRQNSKGMSRDCYQYCFTSVDYPLLGNSSKVRSSITSVRETNV